MLDDLLADGVGCAARPTARTSTCTAVLAAGSGRRRIDGDRLTLTGRRDGRGLVYRAGTEPHSHSMVPGGLLVTSRVTRLTSGTSLVIRVEILASTS